MRVLRKLIPLFVFVSLTIFGTNALSPVNLVYSQVANLTIDASSTHGAISPLLFGNNIEWTWLGNGIWDPQANNFRPGIKSVLEPLKIQVMRFPGGTLSDQYIWQYGIGSPASRGNNLDLDNKLQKSLFGTDEFYRLLSLTAAVGIITVNAGTGTPEDAANWVEYCNGSSGSTWGKIRSQNGFTEPFGVKYWEIGNELFNSTEPGSCDITTYAQRVIAFANAMKSRDSSIQIGAVVKAEPREMGDKDTVKEWNKTLLELAVNHINFLSVHIYEPGSDGLGLSFFSNGTRTLSFQCNQQANYEFRILARGTPVSSVYPIMECQVDSKTPRQISVASDQWKIFTFSENLATGIHELKIAFINDAYRAPEDRNLLISEVTVLGPSGIQTIDIADQSELFRATMASSKRVEWQLQELRNLINTVLPEKASSIKIAATEFNALYGNEPSQLALTADFKSGLLSADMLQVFLRKQVFMANFWSALGNGYFGALKDGQTLVRRPSYHALSLLAGHKGNTLLNTVTTAPTFSSQLFGDYDLYKNIEYLSVISSIAPDRKKLFISVINKHETDSIQTAIALKAFDPIATAQVWTLTAPSANSSNETTPDTVKPSQAAISSVSQTFTYNFLPKSLTLMQLTSKGGQLRSPTKLNVITQ